MHDKSVAAPCSTFPPSRINLHPADAVPVLLQPAFTGDATVNHDAPVICCTAETLANIALRDGAHAPVDDLIMDEFHYDSDHSRSTAWQIFDKRSEIPMESRFPLIARSSWNMEFP